MKNSTMNHCASRTAPTFSSYLSQSSNGRTIDWDKDFSLFSSPQQTFIGSGIALSVALDENKTQDIPQQIQILLDRARCAGLEPFVLGALSFEEGHRSRFIVPESVTVVPSYALRSKLVMPPKANHELRWKRFVPEPAAYKHSVEQAIQKIRHSDLEKVVLARMLELEIGSVIDIGPILDQLMCRSTSSYVFSLPPLASSPKENAVFLGASPELLIRKDGDNFCSNPLAGSIATSPNPAQNEANRRILLTSEKDRREHEFVRRAVVECLRPLCSDITVADAYEVVSAGPIMHLSSRIRGRLKSSEITSLSLAQRLHPTPAVCGTPNELAKSTIRDIETFDRGLYAGTVGWCDAKGNGEWAVSLRCAEIDGNIARLYSGAGIVEASCPQSELQETDTKLETMLNVLSVHEFESQAVSGSAKNPRAAAAHTIVT